jgi:hypothetical protein
MRLIGFILLAVGPACSDVTGLSECHGDVQVVVTPGPAPAAPVFSWTPGCGLSSLAVFDRGDQSQIFWNVSAPVGSNSLAPPITYGVTPKGATGDPATRPLVPDGAYLVRVFRITQRSDGGFDLIPSGEQIFNQ